MGNDRQWEWHTMINDIQWGMTDNVEWHIMENDRWWGIIDHGEWQWGMTYNG